MNKCFLRPPHFTKRIILMILGVWVQGFGLSILRTVNLGVDPCSCLTQGVANYLPFSFGTCQLLCHLITFIFVIRYDMSYISDLFAWIWNHVLPAGFFATAPVRYFIMIPGLAVFLFGAAAYMCSGLGSSPYDALPFIISKHVTRISFETVRILWDMAFMAVGFLLGGTMGIVTVAVAFFCGPVVARVQRKLERIIA